MVFNCDSIREDANGNQYYYDQTGACQPLQFTDGQNWRAIFDAKGVMARGLVKIDGQQFFDAEKRLSG